MVFYYVVCDASPNDSGFKSGRTLITSCRTRFDADMLAARRNRFNADKAIHFLVVPHDADSGAFECDDREEIKLPQTVLVG